MLLGLGIFAFWMHSAPDSYDARQTMVEARSDLRPLAGATTTPRGGGMVGVGAPGAESSATSQVEEQAAPLNAGDRGVANASGPVHGAAPNRTTR